MAVFFNQNGFQHMTTATRAPKPTAAKPAQVQRLETELEDARQQLGVLTSFLDRLQTFSDVVTEAKNELRKLRAIETEMSTELSELRKKIRSISELVSATNDGMLAVIEPGPSEFMPLFDKMQKADTKKHGKNAAQWREQPISVLRLSPTASAFLIEAEILFIGQLQDVILDDPETWWEFVPGLTAPIAAAIADKLNDFAGKGGVA